VVTIHDLDFLQHPERNVREVRRDYGQLARTHASQADVVVAPSRYTADRILSCFNLSPDKVVVCPNGAPGWAIRPPAVTPEHLLFVGTVSARKNVTRLLDAYARVRRTNPDAPPLVLAGQVSADDAEILAPLDRAPLAGHVRHEGYVGDERLRTLYEQAVALILPSLDEGFGIPALEAMEMGVPVLAARRGALPEVVGNAGLLVDPVDIDALEAGIERLVTDAALRRRLELAGPIQARRFSWDSSSAHLRDAYELAIEHRRARGSRTP
jgi:glycosyltransferase involved in cell wall biosynthesis